MGRITGLFLTGLVLPGFLMAQAAGELDYSGWGHHHLHTWWTILLIVGVAGLVAATVAALVWFFRHRTAKH